MDNFDSFFTCSAGHAKFSLWTHPEADVLPRDKWDGSDPLAGFEESEIRRKEEIFVAEGECVYVPKGWIYSFEHADSRPMLLVHVFTNVFNSVADVMQLALPQAMEASILAHPKARAGLPSGFPDFAGVAHSDKPAHPLRRKLLQSFRTQFEGVMDQAMASIDAAVDQHVKNFTTQRFPVPLDDWEEEYAAEGAETKKVSINITSRLRMVRPGIARAVVEDGCVVVYHCMDNHRRMYDEPIRPMEFELDDGPAIEKLLSAYPSTVAVGDIPHPSEELEDKVEIAKALFKEGFLLLDPPTDEGRAVAVGTIEGDEGGDLDESDSDCPF